MVARKEVGREGLSALGLYLSLLTFYSVPNEETSLSVGKLSPFI